MHLEEEVDFLLRMLPHLKTLNGLPVEHDAVFSSDGEDSQMVSSSRLHTEEGGPIASSNVNMTINAQITQHIPEEQDVINLRTSSPLDKTLLQANMIDSSAIRAEA